MDDETASVEETVAAVLETHPVSVGYLFGSHARGDSHDRSDVDVAVVFDGIESGESGYKDAFLGLSGDLAVALRTDDVDLVDLEQAPPSLVRTVFDHGVRLVGGRTDARDLRERLATDEGPQSSVERLRNLLITTDYSL